MKIFYSIIFLIFLSINHAYSLNEIIIKFKIENEIITNKDIENEKKYLVSLNNDLLNISKTDLKKIAEESIIREKIKKIEILKYVKLDNNSKLVDEVIKEYYLDKTDQSGRFVAVTVRFLKKLKKPVTLVEIKKNKQLSHLSLIRQSRLSVMPVDSKSWKILNKMGKI